MCTRDSQTLVIICLFSRLIPITNVDVKHNNNIGYSENDIVLNTNKNGLFIRTVCL